MAKLSVYIGRDTRETIRVDVRAIGASSFAVIGNNVITRAIWRMGALCLDTDEVDDADLIELTENKTRVDFAPGLMPDLTAGEYTGYLTIFTADHTNGKPVLPSYTVTVVEWPVCPVVTP